VFAADPNDCERTHEETAGVIADAPLTSQIWHVICSLASGFANVAFTGSLLLSLAMTAAIILYAKRRPKDAELTWGQAMWAATYVSFLLFFFFGVVPDRWRVYSAGELGMRSDAILMGPGSTGWIGPNGLWKSFPLEISKATVSDLMTVNIYMAGLVGTFVVWGIWQKRGEGTSDEVETSTYGRPLVKS
jgi:hypothetical protein